MGGGSPGSFDDEGPPVNFNPTKSVSANYDIGAS